VNQETIKLLIADDSPLVREVLRDVFQDTSISVIGEATNGEEAVKLTKELGPDIITMDVMMPVMDGLTAVEEIMAFTPTPILVFTSVPSTKDRDIPFEAIRRGALDVMEKPKDVLQANLPEFQDELINKIRLLSNIKVISHLKGRRRKPTSNDNISSLTLPGSATKSVAKSTPRQAPKPTRAPQTESDIALEHIATPEPTTKTTSTPSPQVNSVSDDKLLAIGASTGGPRAVMQILTELPHDYPAGIVLVQHIGAGFSTGFAEWLNKESKLTVQEASGGETIKPGLVLVAPGNSHMEIEGSKVVLTQNPPVNSCRPSADILLSSAAQCYGNKVLGLILTGMGKDGAVGMAAIKKAGGQTIAQDEETSIIFGMPKAAIDLGVIDYVLPISDISRRLIKLGKKPINQTDSHIKDKENVTIDSRN